MTTAKQISVDHQAVTAGRHILQRIGESHAELKQWIAERCETVRKVTKLTAIGREEVLTVARLEHEAGNTKGLSALNSRVREVTENKQGVSVKGEKQKNGKTRSIAKIAMTPPVKRVSKKQKEAAAAAAARPSFEGHMEWITDPAHTVEELNGYAAELTKLIDAAMTELELMKVAA
jgi:hypothetical protein